MGYVTRRAVLAALCGGFLPIMTGSFILKEADSSAIELPDNSDALAMMMNETLAHQLADIVQNPRKALSFSVPVREGTETITLSCPRFSPNRPILRLTRNNGEDAYVKLGINRFLQTRIRLTDARDQTLIRDNTLLEAPFSFFKRDDFVETGITVSILALLAWSGITVLKVAFIALGVIAFWVMILALMVGTALIALPLAKKLLNRLGLSMDDARAYFGQGAEKMKQLLISLFIRLQELRKTFAPEQRQFSIPPLRKVLRA